MESVRLIDPSRDKRWDVFVESHPWGWICQTSAWGKLLEQCFKHIKGYYLVLFDGNDNIKAGLPIFSVESWLMGKRMVSIPHATLCDPLVSNPVEMEQLVGAAITLSNKLGMAQIEVRTLMSGPLFCDERFDSLNYFKHHYLPLVSDPEQLKKSFHRSCVRQRIARALGSELDLKVAESKSDLDAFYALHVLTRQRHSLPPQPHKFFELLWQTFYPSGHVELLLATLKGRPVASLIVFKFKNRVSAEFAASDEHFRDLSPNHLLFWEAIKMACREGFEIFDFGRTPPHNQELMDFKRRWGTMVMDLPHFFYPRQTAERAPRDSQRSYKLMQTICRKCPDAMLPLLGRFCYRHLG